jgi:hypothetical protein
VPALEVCQSCDVPTKELTKRTEEEIIPQKVAKAVSISIQQRSIKPPKCHCQAEEASLDQEKAFQVQSTYLYNAGDEIFTIIKHQS